MSGRGGQLTGSAARVASRWLAAMALAALVSTCAVLAVLSVRGLGAAPLDLDTVVSAMAAALVAAVLALWCCGAVVTAAAIAVRATGRASTALDALARATTPAVVRRLVAVALGAGVLGGVAGPALAAAPVHDLTWPTASGPSTSAPSTSTPTVTSRGSATSDPPAGEVVVRPGDSLWGIAAAALPPAATARDVARAWPHWYAANRAVIGDDPGLLRPGQHLSAPASSATALISPGGGQR